MSRWQEEKHIVLEAARQLPARGLVVGTAGNLSLRLPADSGRELLAVTPSARYYDTLAAEDIQVVDFAARPVEGDLPPSIETKLHIGIYRARPAAGAVVHTHSVYASALAVAGRGIPAVLEDQVAFLGGDIRVAGAAPAGSDEEVERIIAALEGRSAALLPNHGAVALGRDMREAVTAAEILEKTAQSYLLALGAGNANPLPAATLRMCLAVYAGLRDNG